MPEANSNTPKFLLVDMDGTVTASNSPNTVAYAEAAELVVIDLENRRVPWMSQSFAELKDVTAEADEYGDLEVEPEEE